MLGWNEWGQLGDATTTDRSSPVPVVGLASGVTAIAVGAAHTCALTAGGQVVCWGMNGYGQLGVGSTVLQLNVPWPVQGLGGGVVAIAAGGSHTCALTSAGGGVLCWGDNALGQVGDGTTTIRRAPAWVSGLTSGVLAITAGARHTCARTTGEAAKCWGENTYGQLGDGTTANRYTPTAVADWRTASRTRGGRDAHLRRDDARRREMLGRQLVRPARHRHVLEFVDAGAGEGARKRRGGLDGGYAFTCGRSAGGDVRCWGRNGYGQIGDGTETNRGTPTPVVGLQGNAAAVAAGWHHVCAVTANGAVRCWGDSADGRLGDGTVTRRLTPTAAPGLANGIRGITVGTSHTCALNAAGGARCWGDNAYGQLGDGTTTTRLAPAGVSGLARGVAAVVASASRSCALTVGGAVLCWGSNSSGLLGDGTAVDRLTPAAVIGLGSGVAAVGMGSGYSCALTTGGAVLCWGANAYGQIGDGTTTNRPTPVPVTGLPGAVAAIAVGAYHTCALTTSGGVVCWGSNYEGGLGDGTTDDQSVPAPVSGLASGVSAISAGLYHSCALMTSGAVRCWGSNSFAQLGDGTTVNRLVPTDVVGLDGGVASISAGAFNTCAVSVDGGAACWGSNNWGQLGDGTTSYRATPTAVPELAGGIASVDAGFYHTCAVTTAGAGLCWGRDNTAQLGLGTRLRSSVPIPVYGFGGEIAAGATAPAHGSTGGGTAVAITGAYFLQGAAVMIGGVPATSVTVVNTETITATTGAHAAGSADVVVTNPDGTQATLADAFRFGNVGLWRTDFTGDSRSDLLWRHASGGDAWLWPMDGAVRTAETFVRTVADTAWEIRGLGDQDGDGKPDLLWRNAVDGQIYFWPMDGATPLDEIYVATVDPAYGIAGTGDVNGDGKSDILWRHTALGDVWIWLMDGPRPLSQVYIDCVDPAYVAKGVGDFDANGRADIVWHHATTGEVWVWPMNGTTRIDQVWVGTVPDTGYQIQAVSDFTGDGKADLLWWHTERGEVWIWTMNGAARQAETWVAAVPDTDYRIVSAGDFDGDGMADILWHHATRGEVWVWLIDGTTRLSETLVGTVPDVGYRIIR